MQSFTLPQNIFFTASVINDATASNEMIRKIDRGLEKSILSDTLFELFFAIKRYAKQGTELNFKAAKEKNTFYLLANFVMEKKNLLALDYEIESANQLQGKTKQEIYERSVKQMRKKHSLDGFNMVMAYAKAQIFYKTQEFANDDVLVTVFLKLHEN